VLLNLGDSPTSSKENLENLKRRTVTNANRKELNETFAKKSKTFGIAYHIGIEKSYANKQGFARCLGQQLIRSIHTIQTETRTLSWR